MAADTFVADILVNAAAGAWADEIARLGGVAHSGWSPERAALLDPSAGLDPTPWPMVLAVDERFYFKPEAGNRPRGAADQPALGRAARAFVADPDRLVGRDPAARAFVWLAGQGGAGIMTAPALAQLAGGLILDGRVPAELGRVAAALGPAHLRAG